jgi:CheY-like chemotaxis protein
MHKRILIVDHNAPIRGLMKAVIEARTDLEVWEATDGQEGIEKSQELKPDLIILDFALPRMNGLEAAAALHRTIPKSPIILFTFYKDAIPSRMARDAGIVSVLSKWDQLDVLADEVRKLTA